MAKKQRGQPSPAIGLSNLGPRLARLLADPAFGPEALAAEIGRLTDGLKPASFLPIVIGALASARPERLGPLRVPVGGWLQDRGLLAPLGQMVARHQIHGAERSLARELLEAAGVAVAPEEAVGLAGLFLDAYAIDGAKQDSPTVFWYDDERRRRVRTASFLIDFHPPWDGALKDIAYGTYRDLDHAVEHVLGIWREDGIEPVKLGPEALAGRVWAAFRKSQELSIRLPADLIAVLPQVMPFLQALPAPEGTTPMTDGELVVLAADGRVPEHIRRQEQLLGYQTRLPDGTIVHMLPGTDIDPL